MPPSDAMREELESAIGALEAQRSVLGEAVVGPALAALRRQLERLASMPLDAELPQEERKNVTVMFADVSGFSDLARVRDPEETRALINACFDRIVPVVTAHGGTVDKFLGDAVLALFGAPVAHEDDPERALRAALDMQGALTEFNRDEGTTLQLHFGVNTGRVVTGGVGAGQRQEYSVIGRAVNVAARLEQASPPGEIFVGLETYRRTASTFEFEPLPPLVVQGEDVPIPAFRLLRPRASPASARGIAGLRSPLVGRQAELERVRSGLAGGEGRGVCILVVGEPGLGKSRLVAEVRREAHVGAEWIEARALAHTRAAGYAVARTLVHGLLGTTRDVSAQDLRRTLHAALRSGAALRHPFDFKAYLARVLDLPAESASAERLEDLAPDVVKRRIADAIVELVRVRAAQQPLVLVWEDVHWADLSSIEVLEAILSILSDAALGVLVVCRSDEPEVPALLERIRRAAGERLVPVDLEPLRGDESLRLLTNLLDVDDVPDAVRAGILERAEGNPFFLEEILRSLVEQGVVVVCDGRARSVGAAFHLQLPATVEGVVASRIDRLRPRAKHVLQVASVVGRIFQRRILEGVASGSAETAEQLEHLCGRAFVRRRTGATDDEYIFTHAITHEVAYETLLRERRRDLHRRVGEVVEALWPEAVADRAALLGEHFRRGEIAEKAVRYLALAGDRARATFANREALSFYRSALDVLARDPGAASDERRCQLLESTADLLALGGSQDEARTVYEEALAAAAEDVLSLSRLHRKIAHTWEVQREFGAALERYERGEAVLGPSADADESAVARARIDVRLDRLWVHYFLADAAQMERELEAVRDSVERAGTAAQRSLFFSRRANMASRRDRYRISAATLADAQGGVAASLESGDSTLIATARFLLGLCHLCRAELDPAEAELQAALMLTRRTGDVAWETRCRVYLGVASRRRGLVAESRRYAEDSLRSIAAAGLEEYRGAAGANLAWTAWKEGEAERAVDLAREALAVWERTWAAYPFKWLAAWPLAAAALDLEDLSLACGALPILLEPPQQPLPPHLAVLVREAVEGAEARDADRRTRLVRAVEAATAAAYL